MIPYISNELLEDMNETLAAMMAQDTNLGILKAGELYQVICEVQAWRRWAGDNDPDGHNFIYNPNKHEIVGYSK